MKEKFFLCSYGMRSTVQLVVCSFHTCELAYSDYWVCVVVPITPSRTWSQTPTSTSAAPPSLLGLSMRLCTPESALENVWHILEVLEGSPAESAGLVPYGDWILGWAGGVLASEGDFYEVVESHIDKPLRVYVFSYDFECVNYYYAHPFILIDLFQHNSRSRPCSKSAVGRRRTPWLWCWLRTTASNTFATCQS